VRKKKEEPLARTEFPIEPITLTLGQLQASASWNKPYATVGDTIHWRCNFPIQKGKICPFTVDEKAAASGRQDYPDVMVIHMWEEGHYEMSARGGTRKVPIVPGKPRGRDEMIDELLENMAEAHKDLTIALDRYDRETREVITFLRGNG
jgi:hypothetical protein